MTVDNLAPDQRAALNITRRWYQVEPYRSCTLFGPAGTGKTSIAEKAAQELAPGRTVFLAPTGKAASVLRAKECPGAQTIHSAIYVPADEKGSELAFAEEELEALQADRHADPLHIAALRQRVDDLRKPTWTLRHPDKAFGGKQPRLLVVDEASMVSAQIAADLASFRVPILALGDDAQLPPVGGTPGYPGPADATLTTIHRYGDVASLMELATAARTGARLPDWDGTAGRFDRPYHVRHLAKFDQVIVGRNVTRWNVVNGIRAAQGRRPGVPERGDKLLVLRNDPSNDVVNGHQAVIEAVEPAGRAWAICTTDNEIWMVDRRGFVDHAGQQAAEADRGSGLVAATFANAVTAHKAQGSQWPCVAVIDESGRFGENARRWLYTAATRASERCIVLARQPHINGGPR